MANVMDKYKSQLAKLNKPRKGGSGMDYISLNEGKNTVRLLPGHPNMDGFYTEVFYHKRKMGGKNISVVCSNAGDEDGGKCPICEQLEPMRRSKDKKIKDAYYSWRAKPRYFANAVDRSRDELKVEVLAFGAMILKQLLEIIVDPEEFGDILDPKEGTDILIKKTGEGLDTSYTVTPRRQPSPLSESSKEIKQIIGKTAEDTHLLDLSGAGNTELSEEDLLKLWDGENLEEDEEEDEAPKKKGKKSSKKVEEEDEEEEEEEEEPKPKKGKKASKKVEEEDEEEEEAPKAKKKAKKVDEDDEDDEEDEEDEAPKKKGKKASKKVEEEEEEEEEEPKPKKKAKAPVKDEEDEDDEEEDLDAVLAKHAKKKAKK